MPKNDHLVYVPADIAFPGQNNSFQGLKEILSELSRTDTVLWCIRINQILASPHIRDEKAKQEYVLRYFTPEQIASINEFARQHGGAQNVRIFFRGQLMELMRWALLLCEDKPNDGITFKEVVVKQRFARGALICSDLWSCSIYTGDKPLLRGEIPLHQVRRVIDIQCPALGEEKALGRGQSLVMTHFMAEYPELAEEFENAVGISIQQYYFCATSFLLNYLPRSLPAPGGDDPIVLFHQDEFCSTVPHAKDRLARFLELESQSMEELKLNIWGQRDSATPESAGPFRYRALRDRPILTLRDGRCIILDPVFFSDKLPLGPLFHLVTSKALGQRAGGRRALFPVFGRAFERYCRELLSSMFGTSTVLVKRLSSPFMRHPIGKEKEAKEISDACLNDISDLVLFEMKARFVPEDSVYSDDLMDYQKELNEKIGEGASQLATAIDKLENETWLPVDQDIALVKKVFPVLLVYDRLLDSLGHNKYFAEQFGSFLGGAATTSEVWLQKGKWLVAPLTIVTIEMLENLQSSVEKFSLVQLLADYTQHCPDRSVSLQGYLADSKYNSLLIHSRLVADHGLTLLDGTLAEIFNDKLDDDQSV